MGVFFFRKVCVCRHLCIHFRAKIVPWAFCGFSVSNICASIIMMQKVAANVDNVAADLCFRASEVRWLLMKIFFALAASSAADFVCFYLL